MKALYTQIKEKRIILGFKTKEIAASLGIDQALISKYENGKRLPTRDQVIKLSGILQLDTKNLLILFTKELLMKYVSADEISLKALSLVQEELRTYQKEQIPINKNMDKLLKQLDLLKKQLDKIKDLDNLNIKETLELEYTFNSNKIEGNTLTLQETNLIINEGLTITGKTMKEHLEAVNHNEAIAYIKDVISADNDITESLVLQLHSILMRGIQGNRAGKYRTVQLVLKESEHIPPQAFIVPKRIEALFIWYRTNKGLLHPVALAAEMYHRFITISPFLEGNGRTSRLLMNLILIQHGFAIANMKGEPVSILDYQTALDRSLGEENKESFHRFVAETERADLERYLDLLDKQNN